MKYFKIHPHRTAKRYLITPRVFLKVTDRKFPFEQINERRMIMQYGICPSCLNPIQLIGVVKSTERVYGKHTGKNIKGLPHWNQRKYEYCPFATVNSRRLPNDDEWLTEIDNDVIELYRLLKEQFDRVVYILEKELNIRCSLAFWNSVLRQFLVNKAYLYPWLTESNLPYIFAYFGMTHQNVYNQKVCIDSEIYKALAFYSGVELVPTKNGYARITNKNSEFINLGLRFTNHSHKVLEGETLVESMMFFVDDLNTGNTIFQKRIDFSETYFMNIVNKEENVAKRQQQILNLADELMPDIK